MEKNIIIIPQILIVTQWNILFQYVLYHKNNIFTVAKQSFALRFLHASDSMVKQYSNSMRNYIYITTNTHTQKLSQLLYYNSLSRFS